MGMANTTLKYIQISDSEVLERLNNLAIDAQWDVNSSKSPKLIREAQEKLNLFASAVSILKDLSIVKPPAKMSHTEQLNFIQMMAQPTELDNFELKGGKG